MTQTNHDSTITETLDTIIPYARKITVGSVVGYCSGIAAKTIGKMIAVTLGLGFIAIQSAVYVGYVQVDWNKIQKHAVAHVDVDGDGEISVDDLKYYWTKVKNILTTNLMDAGGFSLGFLYGVSS